MSLKYLKSNRTRYRNLLERDVLQAKGILSDVLEEDTDLRYIKGELTAVISCIKRLTYFGDKLNTSIKELSVANEELEDKLEIDSWIEEDSDFMTSVENFKTQLTDLETRLNQRHHELEKEKTKEPSLGKSLSAMCKLQSEMQQLLQIQQDQIKQHHDQQYHRTNTN